jgi:adenylate cyclase class IV
LGAVVVVALAKAAAAAAAAAAEPHQVKHQQRDLQHHPHRRIRNPAEAMQLRSSNAGETQAQKLSSNRAATRQKHINNNAA